MGYVMGFSTGDSWGSISINVFIFRSHNEEGIKPSKLFACIRRLSKLFVNKPKELGIVPVNLLEKRFAFFIASMYPSSLGSVPVKQFF
jgi:hypothetical protein